MNEILSVRNLKTYFYVEEGEIKAVDDVSFLLKKGETLGIAGESGSGKTVTALSILRLISWPPGKIIDGKIYFNRIDLLKLSNKSMREIRGKDISMIFQEPMASLNPVLTVGNQIMEPLILHQNLNKDIARKKAINLLKEVGISNAELRIKQFPHEFSGGMLQRVMIAMALGCKPKILIADEPTSSLDVTIQAQILNLMNRVKNKFETSIIIITHDLGVIAEMADSIIIMYAGKIVEFGDSGDIFYNSYHPYTLGLLKSIPGLDEKKKKLNPVSGNPPSSIKLPNGCRFSPRCKYAKRICFKIVPELKAINGKHKSACHLNFTEIQSIKISEDNYDLKQ